MPGAVVVTKKVDIKDAPKSGQTEGMVRQVSLACSKSGGVFGTPRRNLSSRETSPEKSCL